MLGMFFSETFTNPGQLVVSTCNHCFGAWCQRVQLDKCMFPYIISYDITCKSL